MNKVANEKERFINYLSKISVKFTRCREAIFNEVMNTHGHFTAEELVKQFKINSSCVSRATIYRGLKELLEAGIVRETAFGDKHNHYEHVYDEKPHHHAKCIRCGSFLEFDDLGEDKLYHSILEKKGFKILGHEMHFYGFCQDCQK